ncbi:MAG: hypothetical protein ACOYI8_03565 [Christensenellales bacterium]|jgi:hypothetical protein
MGRHTGRGNSYEPRLISSWGYIGYSILFSIPVVGLIFLIAFSFSRNENRRNYARSYWCWFLIAIVLMIALSLTLVISGKTPADAVAFGRDKLMQLNAYLKDEINIDIASFLGIESEPEAPDETPAPTTEPETNPIEIPRQQPTAEPMQSSPEGGVPDSDGEDISVG